MDEWLRKAQQRDVLWARERSQCESCAHYYVDTESYKRDGATAIRCRALKSNQTPTNSKYGRILDAYCIDAREQGAPCGPSGNLFTPKGGKR